MNGTQEVTSPNGWSRTRPTKWAEVLVIHIRIRNKGTLILFIILELWAGDFLCIIHSGVSPYWKKGGCTLKTHLKRGDAHVLMS